MSSTTTQTDTINTAQAEGSNPADPPSKKSMTKAERREIQERQRAEKAAKAAEKPAGGPSKGASKQAGPSTPKKSSKPSADATASKGIPTQASTSKVLRDLKEGSTTHEDLARRTHGLRIFSHFGLTKAVSGKGNIHPAVIRLALLFSSFKITGANARCMATLTAFKQVCTILIISLILKTKLTRIRSFKTTPLLLIRHSQDT
jgi:translation initiation factor eIF-2B subunit delta